ncbi:MAG: hypothetical protein JWM32_3107 [Verrucomicrobia bacterium]|nr:hypothetical protein [Verrucomicrobiota bacterium]
MKYVRKAGEPHEYRLWRQSVSGTTEENFRTGLKNPVKRLLHVALVGEQGALCAYTMKRIDSGRSHIEHIKPESVCRAEGAGLDLEYRNLLACFPLHGMDGKYRYGAQERGNWWEDNGRNFVIPLQPNCEHRFRFDLRGRIHPVGSDAAATATIKHLGLDHPTLAEDRRGVIRELIYGGSGDRPLTAPEVVRYVDTICHPDGDGHFNEFCVAIRDALREYLITLRKLSQRRKFARRKQCPR